MSLESDCLLAVTGLIPDTVSAEEKTAAAALPEEFSKRIRTWLGRADKLPFRPPAQPATLDAWFDKLAAMPTQEEVAGYLHGIDVGNAALGAEYFMGLVRAREYLTGNEAKGVAGIWPRFSIDSLAGPIFAPLAFDDAAEVWSVLAVLDEPTRLLDEFDSWTLTPSQAKAFHVCYPDLYDLIRDERQRHASEKRAKNKNWDPGWQKEAVFRTFLEMPPEAIPASPPPAPPKPDAFELDAGQGRTQADVSGAPKSAATAKGK